MTAGVLRVFIAVVIGAASSGLAACGSSEAATQDAATHPPATPQRAEVTLAIDGMACDACAGRIEKELRDREGVHEASVDFAAQRARVVFDPARVTANELDETVDALGFASRIAQ